MCRPANPGKPRRTAKGRALFAWSALGLCGLAGCSSTQSASTEKAGDPLLGPAPPPTLAQPVPPASTTGPAANALPPIPPANGSATPAALASQTKSLAIGAGDNWQRLVEVPSVSAGAARSPVQPVVVPVPKANDVGAAPAVQAVPATPIQPTGWQAGSPPAPVAAPPSEEQLAATLKQHGVEGYRFTKLPDGKTRLECMVPSRNTPGSYQNFDTVAADNAVAVQAILQQIDGQSPR